MEKTTLEEADENMRAGVENAQKEGLATYGAAHVAAVLAWIGETCSPIDEGEKVNSRLTSNELARMCSRDLRRAGHPRPVTNLAMKSALHLSGYDPATPNVEFCYYRMKYDPRKRKGNA